MREQQATLDAADLQVFVVTFESAKRVGDYQAREPVAFPVLRDPHRDAYCAFGFARNPRRALAMPTTGVYYLRNALRGRLPRLHATDMLQLGGDVVLSAGGDVCWVHASREPADRPSIDDIVRAVSECQDDR